MAEPTNYIRDALLDERYRDGIVRAAKRLRPVDGDQWW